MSGNRLPGVPVIDSPFFEDHVAGFDAPSTRVARDLRENGYSIIDFPDERFGENAAAAIEALRGRCDFETWRRGQIDDLRLQDQWKSAPGVKAIAANANIIELLSRVYGRRAFPFQTLNFPVGAQLPPHSDHVHFSSVPERFMCAVWVALEDVDETNGPLETYPGTQKWPLYGNENIGFGSESIDGRYLNSAIFNDLIGAIVHRQGLEPRRFLARKGQAMIWAANLVHATAKHEDKNRTRWTQVTHYLFEGCGYTRPLANDPFARRMVSLDPVNIATGAVERSKIARQKPLLAWWRSRRSP